MVKLVKRYIKEAKQVGLLYHFCALEDVSKYIAPTDTLSPSGLFWNRRTRNTNTVSFSRNPNLRLNTLRSYDITVRFTVDGDKLSNNHKVMPYSAYGVSSPVLKSAYVSDLLDFDTDEMEEIVVGPIKEFHKYILGVLVTVKKQDITKVELLDNSDFQIFLNYITEFNILRDTVEIIVKGEKYKLNNLLVPSLDDIETIYKEIKNRDMSVVKKLDTDTLYSLFYKIIHELEYDYPYDLITNISECKKELTKNDIEKCRDIFIDIMEKINKDEVSEVEEFMDSLNFK